MNIYETQTMLAALELLEPQPTFLRDRYFPVASDAYFPTEEVLVEYKDESERVLAPVVAQLKGGVVVGRDGYRTDRFTPPYVAPRRPLTIDDLNKKGFGENLFSDITPEQRAADILRRDLTDLEKMIASREEYMAAQAIFTNGYEMPIYADNYGDSDAELYTMRFYDEDTNPAIYTPAEAWSATSTSILGDLSIMCRSLTSRGLGATDVIMSPDVSDVLINNEATQKLLDNRRYELGDVKPEELPAGASLVCRLNVNGRILNFFSYDATYTDENKNTVQFVPEGSIAVTSAGAGNRVYGAVTQMEQADGEFHTYASGRVPHVVSNADSGVRTLTEKSRPLLMPNYKNPWITATVLS